MLRLLKGGRPIGSLPDKCSAGRLIDIFGPTSYGWLVNHSDDGSVCEHE